MTIIVSFSSIKMIIRIKSLNSYSRRCCSYPLAFFRCCRAGAWMWPLGALSAVSLAPFGGRGGRGGLRRRGAWTTGGRRGGWRVRWSTVWRGWRRGWLLLLLHRCWGVICEERLKGHGGSLVVLLFLFRWRVLWWPRMPWKHKWKS